MSKKDLCDLLMRVHPEREVDGVRMADHGIWFVWHGARFDISTDLVVSVRINGPYSIPACKLLESMLRTEHANGVERWNRT